LAGETGEGLDIGVVGAELDELDELDDTLLAPFKL
jgi:hypothetical protein